jgi:hypothetical protein
MRSTICLFCVTVVASSLAAQRVAQAVVIDVSNVLFKTLTPQPIPAGKRLTSFSYEYDYNKESNASVSASFALSITLSADTVLGGSDDFPLGTLNTATGSVAGISGHVQSSTGNLNGISALQVPVATPPGVYNAFLAIAPRSPHTDPDAGDAFGKLPTTVTVIAGASLPGDYTHDGVVDGRDYVLWRRFIGQTGGGMWADGSGNGIIDSSDYDVWRAHFGQTAGSGTSASAIAAVPEPSTWALLLCATAGVCARRQRRIARLLNSAERGTH